MDKRFRRELKAYFNVVEISNTVDLLQGIGRAK